MIYVSMTSAIRVLDGGLSTALEKLGCQISGDPLWSARMLVTDPASVVRAHEQFVRAGADVITTASYQASVDGFRKHLGLTSDEPALKLIESSVDLARQAVRNCGKDGKVAVAGSVGPYGACLHDGSEYSGSYLDDFSITDKFLADWHRPRIEALLRAGADCLAIETMPGIREVKAVLSVLREFPDAKAWVAFSCRDNKSTAHGEDLAIAAAQAVAVGQGQLIGIGVNCCQPGDVTQLLTRMRTSVLPEIGLVAYPNSGELYEPHVGKFYGTPTDLSRHVGQWASVGANLIGGCCRVYPDDIGKMRAALGLV